MLRGGPLVHTTKEILRWFSNQKQNPTYPHHRIALNNTMGPLYHERNKNFSDTAFAYWIFQHYQLDIRPIEEMSTKAKMENLTLATLDATLINLQQTQGYAFPGFVVYIQRNRVTMPVHSTAMKGRGIG